MAQPSFSGLPPLGQLTGAAPIKANGMTAPLSTINGVDPVYNFTHLKYPQEISYSNYQGHYINFFINVHRASEFLQGNSYNSRGIPGPTRSSVGTYQTTNKPTIPLNNLGPTIQSHAYTRIAQAISLYIPDTMSTDQTIQWENASLLKSGQKLLRGMGSLAGLSTGASALKSFGRNALRSLSAFESAADAAKDVAGLAGFAINPQLLVIFRTIEPRSFTYEFYFAPRNEEEAQNVYDIIYTFRFHAAPEAVFNYGAFFIAPSTFDIEFMHKGDRNTWLHQIKTCVLKNYNVDYAPSGWSTHIDGMPVRTRLVLQFQEVDIVCKQDIKFGY
jgi:hypothetical protein